MILQKKLENKSNNKNKCYGDSLFQYKSSFAVIENYFLLVKISAPCIYLMEKVVSLVSYF